METSFFKKFTDDEIFSIWNYSQTLLEIAQKLGYTKSTLERIDYEYIEKRKTREVWKKYILGNDREKERQRSKIIHQLSKQQLEKTMLSDGIQTISHLALHYLLSSKHGRKQIKQKLLELDISVKNSLHKGLHGVSSTPLHYPKKFYEKQVEQKPSICPACHFKANSSWQIELHHSHKVETTPKNNRNSNCNQTMKIIPLCANCHSLQHRIGEHLQMNCGLWKRKGFPPNLKYTNPNDIFVNPCLETYRLQKKYYIHWILSSTEDYKCCECGAIPTRRVGGPQQKLLSLEMNHKDGNQQNSLITNLELLCPNCHRLHTYNLSHSK